MNRGQFAVEYLTTYGWVILSIVVTLSALTYFGMLSPSQYVPDRCRFGYQLICEDFLLEQSPNPSIDGQASFKLRNNFARPINITGVTGVDAQRNITACTTPDDLSVGELGEFVCDVNGTGSLLSGNKYSVPIRIEFQRNASGAPVHYVTGEIFTDVR